MLDSVMPSKVGGAYHQKPSTAQKWRGLLFEVLNVFQKTYFGSVIYVGKSSEGKSGWGYLQKHCAAQKGCGLLFEVFNNFFKENILRKV